MPKAEAVKAKLRERYTAEEAKRQELEVNADKNCNQRYYSTLDWL